MAAPVRSQKAVSRTKENAAVERRKANALRHWACAARRQDVTPRLSALRSLTFREGRCFPHRIVRENHDGAPRASATRGGGALPLRAGCLTGESDVRARMRRSA